MLTCDIDKSILTRIHWIFYTFTNFLQNFPLFKKLSTLPINKLKVAIKIPQRIKQSASKKYEVVQWIFNTLSINIKQKLNATPHHLSQEPKTIYLKPKLPIAELNRIDQSW